MVAPLRPRVAQTDPVFVTQGAHVARMLTWAMHLTLLVPGLLWPREILRDTTFDLPHPSLAAMLGRGARSPVADDAEWIGERFGLAGRPPAAPLRLLGEGCDPDAHDWLCLDPVHLRLEERAIVLDDPAALRLDPDEDEALRREIQPLFAHLGDVVASSPGHWHLRLARPADIETAELPRQTGIPADPALPGGPEGPAWRRLLAEAGPLLHAHPVNRRRADAGLPTVNGLWPWGGGRLPGSVASDLAMLWGNDPVLKGLAALAGIAAAPMPKSFTVETGHVLARFDGLAAARSSFDVTAWREGLARLETGWLTPALAALKRGALRRLTLVLGGHENALRVEITRADLWRIWRNPLPLAELPA